MTYKRTLFLLPLMAMPLVACNNNSMAPIDYAATNELAENYLKIIKESRLKPISSRYKLHANKLDFKGELAMGKSFDLKDFTFSATNKTLLDTEIPTGLYSMVEEKLSRSIGSGGVPGYMLIVKYLLHPEFNPRLLTLIDGFKLNEPNAEIEWDKVEHVPWNTIKRTYSKSSEGDLKIDVSTPSVKQTFDEFLSRFPETGGASITFDAPLYASMSVDKYGYISSASLKFNCKGFNIGNKNKGKGEGIYVNGDINIDATISLSHTFAKIVPIRYQTIEYVKDTKGLYKIKEGGVSGFYDNIDDVKYKRADDSEHKVFTAQWYATNKEEGGGQAGYNYGCDDDPLFNYSFFDEIAMNEAFLHNNYDVVLVPDGDVESGTFDQKVKFLGYNYDSNESDSLCNITVDGNDEMFSHKGIGENTVAGDQLVNGVTIIDPNDPEKKKIVEVDGAYNFYIDKSLIRNDGSYYLITVAFTQDLD